MHASRCHLRPSSFPNTTLPGVARRLRIMLLTSLSCEVSQPTPARDKHTSIQQDLSRTTQGPGPVSKHHLYTSVPPTYNPPPSPPIYPPIPL